MALAAAAAAVASRLTEALGAAEIARGLAGLQGAEPITAAALLVLDPRLVEGRERETLEGVAPGLLEAFSAGAAEVEREGGRELALALRARDRLQGALVLGLARALTAEERQSLRAPAQAAALGLAASSLVCDQLEAQQRAARAERMASLAWVASSFAHEVKNPLAAIKSVAQVLRGEVGEAGRWRRDLEVVIEEVDRLDAAVKRLLGAVRPADPSARKADLVHELRRLEMALGEAASSRGVRFEIRMGGPVWVAATADDLWDVFYNLATNAIEAMAAGGTFRVELTARTAGAVHLVVSDTGPGVMPEVRSQVFDSFFTTKDQGHGLGLALVRRKLKALGGSIRLAEGGPGAVFLVTLPEAAG